MNRSPVVDIGTVIEREQTRSFGVLLIIAMALMMMTEGYDLAAMAFAAPALGRAWHLDHGVLGPVFSSFVFGTMIGAFVLGYLGDVIGRKRVIILGSLVLAVFTLAASLATELNQLLWLRFLGGIGIGGVVPNAIAYITDFAPKRQRATWVTLMYCGYTIGSAVGGIIAAQLIPMHGWQVVFVIGGIAPILASIMVAFVIPESIRFLTVKGRHTDVAKIIARSAPGVALTPDTKFVIAQEQVKSGSLSELFAGSLRTITPVLWLVYIANSFALFFMNSWLPVLIERLGLSPHDAALVTTMFQIGGTVGGLVLMRFVDTRGPIIIAALPIIGIPVVALIGTGLPVPMLWCFAFMSGFTVVGTQSGLNAVASMIYPTALRAKGTGTAVSIQKIGAIAGPLIGGMLISAHVPIAQVFYWGAVPVAIVAVLAFLLGLLQRSRECIVSDAISEKKGVNLVV
jgi:MFS transporter, AAHS family, 4-hydroxybenzoate transporter